MSAGDIVDLARAERLFVQSTDQLGSGQESAAAIDELHRGNIGHRQREVVAHAEVSWTLKDNEESSAAVDRATALITGTVQRIVRPRL